MRIAVGNIRDLTDETIAFAHELGCKSITLNTPPLTGRPSFGSNAIGRTYWVEPGEESPPIKWDFLELLHLRTRIEAEGLILEGIENVPFYFYKKIVLGLPGWEEQLDRIPPLTATFCGEGDGDQVHAPRLGTAPPATARANPAPAPDIV
jgi:mannonate dehydratase